MKMSQKILEWKAIAGLSGLALIIVLALVVPNSGLFQANLPQSVQLRNAAPNCQQLNIIALPQSPLPANTPGIIAVTTVPENFAGSFTYSASSGNLNDELGNTGSYIQTAAKKINYSGGDDGTMITIQAQGEANKNCLATVPVVKTSTTACISLKVVSDPSPLPQNQSAALSVIPVPNNFEGSYLFQADSGEFQMQDADVQATGNQSKTLVTKSRNVLYNGGKAGEKIIVKALGTGNAPCSAAIPITK